MVTLRSLTADYGAESASKAARVGRSPGQVHTYYLDCLKTICGRTVRVLVYPAFQVCRCTRMCSLVVRGLHSIAQCVHSINHTIQLPCTGKCTIEVHESFLREIKQNVCRYFASADVSETCWSCRLRTLVVLWVYSTQHFFPVRLTCRMLLRKCLVVRHSVLLMCHSNDYALT